MRSNPVLSYYKIKIQTPADELSAGEFFILLVLRANDYLTVIREKKELLVP